MWRRKNKIDRAREKALQAAERWRREDDQISFHGNLHGRLEMSEFLVEEQALTDEEMDEKWRDPFPHNNPGDENPK
jgi:hypothetical protein